MDSQLRARHGNKLAAEVRAGRPGRARLRAYCNGPTARITYGHVAWSCNGDWDDCRRAWCEGHDGTLFLCAVCGQAEGELTAECPGWQQCDLADWLAGLAKVAWAPELTVPCSWCQGDRKAASNWSPGTCPDCDTGRIRAQVDPAHWVLVAASTGAARAALPTLRRGGPGGFGAQVAWQRSRQEIKAARKAIDAAARWLSEPSEANRKSCENGEPWIGTMTFIHLLNAVALGDQERAVTSLRCAAGILGDQATREAAAAYILSLTGSVGG